MRDAEVVLDQISSFSRGQVTLNAVIAVLGLVSKKAIFDIIDNLQPEHIPKNLTLLNDLVQEGKDSAQLTNAFIEHFRDMMLIKCESEKLVTLSKEDKEKLKEQSNKFKIENILYCIAVLSQAQERMRRQGIGRLLLEMVLIKLSRQQELLPGKVLLEKVSSLEEKLKRFTPGSFATGKGKGASFDSPKPAEKTIKAANIYTPKEAPKNEVSVKKPDINAEQKSLQFKTGMALEDSPMEVMSAVGHATLNLDSIWSIWPRLIKQVRTKKISLGIYLSEGRPLQVQDNIVDIGFLKEYEFHRENLLELKNLEMIENLASTLLDQKIKMNLLSCKELPQDDEAEIPVEEESFSMEEGVQEKQDFNGFIQSAMDVFNGRIIQTDE